MTALVAVLAGGRGRRLGGGKALAELGGEPLVARPLAAARAAGLDAVVVAKAGSALPPVDAPVWLEPAEPAHPLLGIACALERAGGRAVVAVACDMPFVTPGLLARLARGPEAVVRAGGRLQPFPARYEAAALPALREALERGASLGSVLEALCAPELAGAELAALGDPERLTASVNTPAELAAARAALA